MLYAFCMIVLRWFLLLYFRPKLYGRKEYLSTKGGVIFIANHQNLADPIALGAVIWRAVHFMAKKELFDGKVANWFFRNLLVFPVNRKTADFKSLRQALKLLEEGKAFGIFPEGRRAVMDEMDDFEKGTAFIASRCDVPIVPIYISPETYRGWRRMKAIVGEKIYAKEVLEHCEKRELVDALTERMQGDMEKLKRELEGILAKKRKGKAGK
ncbi:MAG: 1-acyl-sn-glycerol-3-phosphate acyltransferase [Clostridia bacterium]|nr:1-acyl-sn-glycerol-3-phosphate acyltransferase [Clostridia bacterium]